MNPSAALAATNAVVNVRPQGMTPTAYIMLVLVVTTVPLLAGILIALIKRGPAMKKLAIEGDGGLQTRLLARIESLELKVDANEADCQQRIDAAIHANDVRWETRLAEHKLSSDQRISELEGDLRQILQQGQSAGQIIALGVRAPAASARANKGEAA